MKVAVTGAAGFIGRHVVAELARRDVACVQVVRPGGRPVTPGAGDIVEIDIGVEPGVGSHERLGRPDVLIHLAWGGLPNYQSLHHFEDELPRQYTFLRGLVSEGLGRMLVTGTCMEYGMQDGRMDESRPTAPETPYALAKDTLRKQLALLRAHVGFGFTWARLFYMYGPGQAANSLYPQLAAAAAAGADRFPMSGGEQLRDYLPVHAVAAYLVDLALNGCDDGTVNVCSGTPVSVRTLVERWIREHGWSIVPATGHYPYPVHEPLAFWGDATRLGRCEGVARHG